LLHTKISNHIIIYWKKTGLLHTKISNHIIIYWKKTGLLHTKFSNHIIIYWKKTGLLHTKLSNRNIIYSSEKPRKSSSLPLKSSSWLFSLNAFKFGNSTYPRRIRHRSNLGHIFQGKKVRFMGREIRYNDRILNKDEHIITYTRNNRSYSNCPENIHWKRNCINSTFIKG
jgi:hypothetical protein